MLKLLSKRDQRFLLILESLIAHQTLSLTQLSEITGTSKRNIQLDIASINPIIHPVTITVYSKEGQSLIIPDNLSIDYLYRCILINSTEFSLIESIFFEKYANLEDYAASLFISLSSLKRMINYINKTTEPLGFRISTSPLQLVGTERVIVNTIANFLSEAYKFDQFPFPSIQFETLDKIIQHVLPPSSPYFNFPDIKMLKTLILVSSVRIKNNHRSERSPNISASFDLSYLEDPFLNTLFKKVFFIELTEQTLYQILSPFINNKFINNYEQLLILAEYDPAEKKAIQAIEDFLENFSANLHIPLKNKEQLTIEIFNSYNMDIGPNYLIYNRRKLFIDNFLHDTPYLSLFIYNGIQRAVTLDQKFERHELEELVYIFITHWEGFAKNIHSLKPKFTVGVFMDSDVEHSAFIATTLNEAFKNELEFTIMSVDSIKNALIAADSFSFVVTNISDLSHKQVPFICIQLYPSTQDFKKIANAYSTLASEQKNMPEDKEI